MRIDDELGSDESAWPAFTDLFSATSLLMLAILATFVALLLFQSRDQEQRREILVRKLTAVSDSGRLFRIDDKEKQFVRLILPERATFERGRFAWSTLRESGKIALASIARVLSEREVVELYRELQVEGHTDQEPYGRNPDFTNWELSAARAAVVARYLVNALQMDPCTISAVGRASYYPARAVPAGIDAFEADRRIEIVIVPNARRRSEGNCDSRGDGSRFGTGEASAARGTALPPVPSQAPIPTASRPLPAPGSDTPAVGVP
jgi:outer membrane protein OmpA-like peptidoglycan-associated protein